MDWRILTAITVLTWGAYNVLLKKASDQIPSHVSMFLFVAAYAVIVLGYSLFIGRISGADLFRKEAVVPVIAGLLCGLGGITYFVAIKAAPGSVFFPLVGLATIVAGIGCLILFREPVSLRIVLGIVCAAAAIILLSPRGADKTDAKTNGPDDRARASAVR